MNQHGGPEETLTRGEALRRRRLAAGIKSVRELQQRSGISREAITSAEAGTASGATYERLDAWFARHERATGSADSSSAQVEYEVHTDDGLRVVVRGLLSDAEELERSVARIIRTIRATAVPGPAVTGPQGSGGAADVVRSPSTSTAGL